MRSLAQGRVAGKWPRDGHMKLNGAAWKAGFQSEKVEVQISAVTLRSCVISSKLLPLSDL